MLVLTRKMGEAIQIGDQVSIEVLEIRGGRVRLGITAPRDVHVQRWELVLDVGCLTENLEYEPAGISTLAPSIRSGRAVAVVGP